MAAVAGNLGEISLSQIQTKYPDISIFQQFTESVQFAPIATIESKLASSLIRLL